MLVVGVPFMYSSCTKFHSVAPWWLTAENYYICPPLSRALIWVGDYITFFAMTGCGAAFMACS